jgi:predicted DNA-binding transcriptional regulator
MAGDRTIGGAILIGSAVGIVIYGLLMAYAWQVTLRVTAFVGAALLLGILAWIGYTMATTPPPEPIEMPKAEPATKEEPAKPA